MLERCSAVRRSGLVGESGKSSPPCLCLLPVAERGRGDPLRRRAVSELRTAERGRRCASFGVHAARRYHGGRAAGARRVGADTPHPPGDERREARAFVIDLPRGDEGVGDHAASLARATEAQRSVGRALAFPVCSPRRASLSTERPSRPRRFKFLVGAGFKPARCTAKPRGRVTDPPLQPTAKRDADGVS